MPKYAMTLNQKVHRNYFMFNDYISGQSIIKIARKNSLTYDRTRSIIKEHTMIIYYVVDTQENFVLYEGNLEDCKSVIEEQYGGLMVLAYQDLNPLMVQSLTSLRTQPINPDYSFDSMSTYAIVDLVDNYVCDYGDLAYCEQMLPFHDNGEVILEYSKLNVFMIRSLLHKRNEKDPNYKTNL